MSSTGCTTLSPPQAHATFCPASSPHVTLILLVLLQQHLRRPCRPPIRCTRPPPQRRARRPMHTWSQRRTCSRSSPLRKHTTDVVFEARNEAVCVGVVSGIRPRPTNTALPPPHPPRQIRRPCDGHSDAGAIRCAPTQSGSRVHALKMSRSGSSPPFEGGVARGIELIAMETLEAESEAGERSTSKNAGGARGGAEVAEFGDS
ncbi:hypothetical protein R3P38DRAFT_3195693 [Favolaschia claudopus]|uniref:Uncharacterized protein n=1 Tax=Favolaschia claudopus TaxID=2862362 RepID=A0AAW0B9S1_9AGAR